jgi:ribosomal-protein-alanine N-acetyltransferase
VRRYLFDDRPVSREAVAEQIDASTRSFATLGFGQFALATLEAPESLIGFAGMRPIAGGGRVELLYALAPEWWGAGLATEAASAVLRFAFEDQGLQEVFAGADAPNRASFRVMERLGMSFDHDAEIDGRPVRYYRILREEFARAQCDLRASVRARPWVSEKPACPARASPRRPRRRRRPRARS